MTLAQQIAEGAGMAVGFSLVMGLGKMLGAIVVGMAHGARPELFPCHACGGKAPCGCSGCPHPKCKIVYSATRLPEPPDPFR